VKTKQTRFCPACQGQLGQSDVCEQCGNLCQQPRVENILVSDSEVWHVDEAPGSDSFLIKDENGLVVGEVTKPYLEEDYPATLATARMMAAAPDLLGACEAAHDYLDGLDDSMNIAVEARVALGLLSEAIAEARGDS